MLVERRAGLKQLTLNIEIFRHVKSRNARFGAGCVETYLDQHLLEMVFSTVALALKRALRRVSATQKRPATNNWLRGIFCRREKPCDSKLPTQRRDGHDASRKFM